MSYPDVVKSTSGQGPQKVVVNVTQRSQPSSAALIESEAGIKKGHVNSIANLFGPKPSAPAAKRVPSSRGRTTARASNEPSLSVHAPNWSVTQTGGETPHGVQPLPGQLKRTKSFGKSDSDIVSRSARLDSNDAPDAYKPTIVFNKTKYVPRLTQSADRSDQTDQQKAQPQGSDIPNPVRVGRWTVYDTLPIKDGVGASRSQNQVKQRELEAKRKREAEEAEWKRREAQERERIADAERRKADYDRRQREELESQERRRRDRQAADEERKRRELLERERKEQEEKRVREETERRKEQEQRRREQLARDRVEQDERRQREEAQRQEELRRREQLERQMEEEKRRREEAERLMKQERTRREQLERDRENEARRRKETEEREEIRRREEVERKVKQERVKEEETRKRIAEEQKMHDSSQDVFTAEEWTVFESVPSTSAEIRGIVPTQVKQEQDCPSYRRFPTRDDRAAFDEWKAVTESEYDRSLRQLEEAQRNRLKEEEAARHQRSRDTERQRYEGMRRSEEQKRRDEESRLRQLEEERRRKEEEERARQRDRGADSQLQRQRDDGKHRGDQEKRFREGVEQWSALADTEDLGQSGMAVGYRRFLDNDNQGTNNGNSQEAGNRQTAENGMRDRDMGQERLRREEEKRRRELEDDKRRREARESEENQQRREAEERENNRRRLEEERRQREEEYRRRADEGERRRRQLEDDRNRREEEFRRASQQRWRNFPDDSDAQSRAEWTVSESVPAKDPTASYTDAMHRSPSHDSITGYRRLIEDSAEQPKTHPPSRYYERKFSRKYVPPDSNGQGHVLTRRVTSGSNEAPTRFEEWTECYSTPSARLQSSGSKGDFRPTAGRGKSDSDFPSTEDAPTFEEWTVFHNAPTSQSRPAYDTTDSGVGDSFGLATPRRSPSKKDSNSRLRRFKSTESLSLLGSGEFVAVEEIMPRRCDTGKRKKDAMIAAALRQLEAGPPQSSAPPEDDAFTARLSPYHSYQRIHSRGGPYQQQQVGEATDNGNVFQENFAVTRDNPAFYWIE